MSSSEVNKQVRVVIASDGKRGHENQSRVLARMLGDTEPLVMLLRDPEGGFAEKVLRLRFRLFGRRAVGASHAGRLVTKLMKPESPEAFRQFANAIGKHRSDYRVFTVSSGTPPATMNLLLAALLDAEPLCNMTPSLLPLRLFKLCVVPEHDGTGKQKRETVAAASSRRDGSNTKDGGKMPQPQNTFVENIVTTPLALGYHDTAAAQLMASQLRREASLDSSATYWALAVGGPGRGSTWDSAAFVAGLYALLHAASDCGAQLLVTTSRRTPSDTLRAIQERIEAGAPVAYLLDAARDDRNPLAAFYELASEFAVTADSFSMVCEAVQAGHKPWVMPVGLRGGRLGGSLKTLASRGLILMEADAHALANAPRSEPNRFYEELRQAVRDRLGLPQ